MVVIIGIVGSEAAKFTAETEAKARAAIQRLCLSLDENWVPNVREVVSGACHLGGIDVWAIEEATRLGIPTREFPPKSRTWADGYKPRNMQIADASDLTVCITVKTLPDGYTGMRFPLCYHCGTADHVKSGGCWTVKYARQRGKAGRIIVIE